SEPFDEFLVRFESQLAKADKLGVEDRDKIELLQMALHIDFDARSRMTKIPSDDSAGAVAAYKDVAAPLRSSTHAGVVYLPQPGRPRITKATQL
ncbi:hypothetical protein E4U22_003302, partial [Claviceps purpurea]